MTASPHIVIIGDTVTQNDPRISKVARSLHEAEFSVTSVGIDKENQTLDVFPWKHIRIKPYAAYDNIESANRISGLNRFSAKTLSFAAHLIKPFQAKAADVVSKAAQRSLRGQSISTRAHYYWQLRWGLRFRNKNYAAVFWESNTVYKQFFDAIDDQINGCDLWIANDWDMLPIVQKLQKKYGGHIWYDSHEFATDEFFGEAAFRKWKQPLVRAVEGDLIKICDQVSTVSPGLCDALQSLYALKETPLCLRNIPPLVKIPYRACADQIHILYQGVVAPGRGLEEMIESTPLWDSGKTLTIRGPAALPSYKNTLQNLIDKVSQTSNHSVKIVLAPSVPFSELVSAAAAFDIGVMALPQVSVHQRFALPNKVFEYMMAGLAVIVSDSRDMRGIVEGSSCGSVFNDLSPQAIADVINAMTVERVNFMKQSSLAAVVTLNWETEFKKMRNSIDALLE